ncbi:MAG: hypothetical protein LBC53_10685 [Spirochaetaceae bacterium]|jgi:hypothetical protein|nr:hypothetical protein [Spirochaetaceae bacterium]
MSFVIKKVCFTAFISAILLYASCKSAPPGRIAVEEDALKTSDISVEEVNNIREKALEAQKKALSVKAEKAAREEYALGASYFSQGENAAANKNLKSAGENYQAAETAFNESEKKAVEKKRLAEDAYKNASQAIAGARRKAAEAAEIGVAIDAEEETATGETGEQQP